MSAKNDVIPWNSERTNRCLLDKERKRVENLRLLQQKSATPTEKKNEGKIIKF